MVCLLLCLCGPPCQLLAANSWRFLFAHIYRNSLFIICSLQNSSYCLLSTISGIFTINALLQQPCVPFHFDKQASFATSTPTNVCLQNHKLFNYYKSFVKKSTVLITLKSRFNPKSAKHNKIRLLLSSTEMF